MTKQCVRDDFPTACDPPDPEMRTPAEAGTRAGAKAGWEIGKDRKEEYQSPAIEATGIRAYRVDHMLMVEVLA